VGTEGALLVDDTHRDVMLRTMKDGAVFPMSSMPGESVGHVFAGPMASETVHFVEAVAFDREVLVKPEEARQVMELYMAADLSAESNEAVNLPLANKRPTRLAAGAGGRGGAPRPVRQPKPTQAPRARGGVGRPPRGAKPGG